MSAKNYEFEMPPQDVAVNEWNLYYSGQNPYNAQVSRFFPFRPFFRPFPFFGGPFFGPFPFYGPFFW
jgi:hypothetical protein